jgi:peptidyl-dipeptidase Dcp
LFHEFGHALHALLSDVTYPSLSGTSVARDFVEFPSKFMEHWIVSAEVLAGFGVPAPLIAAIGQADAFGQGFATVELAGSSIVDLAIHLTDSPALAARFRHEILERGDTRDAMADFVAFRGREPDERHLLLERGLLG